VVDGASADGDLESWAMPSRRLTAMNVGYKPVETGGDGRRRVVMGFPASPSRETGRAYNYADGRGRRSRVLAPSLSERPTERHRKGSTTLDGRRSTLMPSRPVTCIFRTSAVSGPAPNSVHTE
jgi:hypothetical protein